MGKAFLVIVSVLFGIATSEVVVRVFARSLAIEPTTGNQYLFYQYDPVLGWSNKPGTRGVFQRSEFSYQIRINGEGLRGQEVSRSKPAGVRRIAVLGDSFTWGIGAADEQLYTTLLEKSLARSEVLNFGVSDYGPVQYYLLTEKVLSFEPDLVVLSFCLGNDFIDNVLWQRYGYFKPYAMLDENDKLEIAGYPIPNVRHLARDHEASVLGKLQNGSYLFRLVDREIIRRLTSRPAKFGQKGLKLAGAQREFYATPEDSEVKKAVAINAALMRAIARAYADRGIPFVVFAITTKCELGHCFPDLKGDNYVTLKLLKQSLEGIENVTLVDTSEDLGISDFWDRDGHWRPVGHQKATNKLAPVVRELMSDGRRSLRW